MSWGLASLTHDACQSVFGRDWTVSYTPAGQSASTITPLSFDPAHEVVEQDGEVAFSTTKPIVDVQLSDFPQTWAAGVEPLQDDLVTINGTNYQVTDVQPDGHGAAKLLLVEA